MGNCYSLIASLASLIGRRRNTLLSHNQFAIVFDKDSITPDDAASTAAAAVAKLAQLVVRARTRLLVEVSRPDVAPVRRFGDVLQTRALKRQAWLSQIIF